MTFANWFYDHFPECLCDPLVIDGHPYNKFATRLGGFCFYNMWRDPFATICGMANILCWFVLTLPQYIKMYKTKSSAGLSIYMALIWILADSLGVVALLIVGEPFTSTLLWIAAFYVINTSVVALFWLYYNTIYPKIHPKKDDEKTEGLLSNEETDVDALPQNVLSMNNGQNDYTVSHPSLKNNPAFVAVAIAVCATLMFQVTDAATIHQLASTTISKISALVFDEPDLAPCTAAPKDMDPTIGRISLILNILCSVLNSIARLPQIILNHKRKTTQGLSLTYSTLQLTANVFFFISRFLPSTIVYDHRWVITALPWIVSTTFSTFCLIAIVTQAYWFGSDHIKARRTMKYAVCFGDRIFFCLPAKPAGTPDDDDNTIDIFTHSNVTGNNINADQLAINQVISPDDDIHKSSSFVSSLYGDSLPEGGVEELIEASISFVKSLSFSRDEAGGLQNGEIQ